MAAVSTRLPRRSAPETAALAGDVSDETFAAALVGLALERFGRLDIAINNAGIVQGFARLPDIPAERGAQGHRRRPARRLLRHEGTDPASWSGSSAKPGSAATIVNIASVAGLVGAPKLSVYAAAKHGVVGLTRSAAAEYATKGVSDQRGVPGSCAHEDGGRLRQDDRRAGNGGARPS